MFSIIAYKMTHVSALQWAELVRSDQSSVSQSWSLAPPPAMHFLDVSLLQHT